MIIIAVLILFDFKIFKELWQVSRKELLPVIATIIISFTVGVDSGILAGVGVSILLLLYAFARPLIVAQFRRESTIVQTSHIDPTTQKRILRITVTPKCALFFPAAENLKEFFQDSIIEWETEETAGKGGTDVIKYDEQEIIFHGEYLSDSDFTTLKALEKIVLMCIRANKKIQFHNTPHAILHHILPESMLQKVSHGIQEVVALEGGSTVIALPLEQQPAGTR